jgi:hypothetical protein
MEAELMQDAATLTTSRAFVEDMALIDDLERWALQQGPPVDPSRLRQAGDAAKQALAGPNGVLLVTEWLHKYSQSIRLLRQFRNVLVHGRQQVTEQDVKDVEEGAARVLKGLNRRLQRA